MKDGHLLVWPNTVPFNAMLLTGVLPFKTRSSEPIGNYRGKMLFYNSGRFANGHKVLGYGIDSKLMQKRTIIGEAFLNEVRLLTEAEQVEFARRCSYIYGAFPYGYFFNRIKLYKQPIPTLWPQGVVRGAWITPKDFAPWRKCALSNDKFGDVIEGNITKMTVHGKIA